MKQQLNDEAFLTQFENKSLDPIHFNHLGHLRLVWLYLNRYDLDTAVRLVCCGIKAYAESLGAHQKFHLTMTNAIVRIMAKRIEAMKDKDWQLFLNDNRDLVEDMRSVLSLHYTRELLASEAAHVSLVQPDIKSL